MVTYLRSINIQYDNLTMGFLYLTGPTIGGSVEFITFMEHRSEWFGECPKLLVGSWTLKIDAKVDPLL